jgi:hypothetical protein
MRQLGSAISMALEWKAGLGGEWPHVPNQAGFAWLDRLADLLLIFRRPVPVPVRTRRF